MSGTVAMSRENDISVGERVALDGTYLVAITDCNRLEIELTPDEAEALGAELLKHAILVRGSEAMREMTKMLGKRGSFPSREVGKPDRRAKPRGKSRRKSNVRRVLDAAAPRPAGMQSAPWCRDPRCTRPERHFGACTKASGG